MNPDSTPDPLDLEIVAKATAVARMEIALVEMERALTIERIKLDSLRHAASLRPVVRMNGVGRLHADAEVIPRRRGKEKGTISNQWRAVMGRMTETVGQQPFSPAAWCEAAHELGYKMEVKSIRDWLRRGIGAQLGYVDRHGDNYSVSALAIEKFNLKTATPIPDASSGDAPPSIRRRHPPQEALARLDDKASLEAPE